MRNYNLKMQVLKALRKNEHFAGRSMTCLAYLNGVEKRGGYNFNHINFSQPWSQEKR